MEDESLKLDQQLCFPLYAASRLVTQAYQPLLAELDLTYPQYLVFLLLWERDNRRVSDLSRCLFLESNTLTPLLKRLEAKGLIRRSRSLEDERSVLISLSPSGKALKERASAIPQQLLENLAHHGAEAQDLEALRLLLQKLLQGLV